MSRVASGSSAAITPGGSLTATSASPPRPAEAPSGPPRRTPGRVGADCVRAVVGERGGSAAADRVAAARARAVPLARVELVDEPRAAPAAWARAAPPDRAAVALAAEARGVPACGAADRLATRLAVPAPAARW